MYSELLRTPEVLELHALFGPYDFIAKIEANTYDDLGHTVTQKIRSIHGVAQTKTLTGPRFDKPVRGDTNLGR